MGLDLKRIILDKAIVGNSTSVTDLNFDPATQAELDSHAGESNPHAVYLTQVEGNGFYDVLGAAAAAQVAAEASSATDATTKANAAQVAAETTASTALDVHSGAVDPHPGYLTPAEGSVAYDLIGAAAVVEAALRLPWTGTWGAAPADTVRDRAIFPFNGSQVAAIHIAAIGSAPLAGTVAFQKGIGAGGTTMLSTATYALTGLVANTAGTDNSTAMSLTLTLADLQGDLGDGITIEVVNSDQPIVITIVFKVQ